MESKFIAIAFIDAINTQDIEAMSHLFVCPSMTDNQYLPMLPDYRIQVEHIISDCHQVVLVGQAINCHESVAAVWIAQLCGQRIMDWQVYFRGLSSCAN